MQTWELQAFDRLSQKLPAEKSDRRILIIGADERDIGSDKYGYPLPDDVLAQLIDKLQQHQPAAIGVDIFRDKPIVEANTNNSELIPYWQKSNVIAVCLGDNLENSVAPPQAISEDRVGFANIYDDSQITKSADDTVRRYLLSS